MWKALCAGLLALALISVTATSHPAFAEPSARMEAGIARLKAALRLTPEQEKLWPRVEAALRAIASEGDRQQVADASGQTGFLSSVGARATELAVSAAAMRRLASAAQPLVKTLDDAQKREALTLARAMGFGRLAARLM